LVINAQGLRVKKLLNMILSIFIIGLMSGCSQIDFIGSLLGSGQQTESHARIDDDFSDKDSGWGQFIYPEGSAVYKNDAFIISVHVPNSDIFITYPRIYINTIVQSDVNKETGPDDNNYGLICRYEDEKNFYAGQVSSDGYAGIFRIKNGTYQLIGRDRMVPVPAILGGNAVNQMRFECIQNTLTLIVNGEVADTQTDETFLSGEVGMIAGTISGYEGSTRFDNFTAEVR